MIKYHVKEKREKKKMTQKELIEKTGIPRSTISLLENGGDIDIRVSTLKTLAKALGCSVSSLFD